MISGKKMKCINFKMYIFLVGYRIPICFSFLIPLIQRLKSLSSSAWWFSKTFSHSDAHKVHFQPTGGAGRIAGICGVSPDRWEKNMQWESPSCPHSYLPILETFILEIGSWDCGSFFDSKKAASPGQAQHIETTEWKDRISAWVWQMIGFPSHVGFLSLATNFENKNDSCDVNWKHC